MSEKKFQFFISSTYEDLKDAREKVIKTVLSNYHIPIGMEMFSAADEDQWEIIKDTIDNSDYYIVIIGHRYGSMTTDGISFTEKEYDYASQNGIPILAFIRDRNAPTSPKERDDDPNRVEKLKVFIDKVSGKMREVWSNPDDLANKVSIALNKAIRKYERPGWVRADKMLSPQVTEELARLSQENRDFREELAQIKGTIPKIEVLVNGKNCLELKLKRLNPNPESFKRIEYDEIPSNLMEFISKKEVDDYNELIVSKKEEINRYAIELVRYFRLILPDALFVDVVNNGNSSANEVIVEIFFPEALAVLNERTKKEIEGPKKIPGLEESPIEKAKKKYNKSRKSNTLVYSRYEDLIPDSYNIPILEGDNFYNFPISMKVVGKNQVILKVKKLLHTQRERFDDLFIAPLETGDFELKILVICEEYRQKEEFTLPIKIVDSDEDFFPNEERSQ